MLAMPSQQARVQLSLSPAPRRHCTPSRPPCPRRASRTRPGRRPHRKPATCPTTQPSRHRSRPGTGRGPCTTPQHDQSHQEDTRQRGIPSRGVTSGRRDEWENSTLDRFLEALAAPLEGIPDAYAKNEQFPVAPTWKILAEVLVMASGYE